MRVIINETRERIQVKFPKSQKSRIRKKWRKNLSNWGFGNYIIKEPVKFGSFLIVNPEQYSKIKENSIEFNTDLIEDCFIGIVTAKEAADAFVTMSKSVRVDYAKAVLKMKEAINYITNLKGIN